MTKETIQLLEEIIHDLREISNQLNNPDATIIEQSYYKGMQFSIKKIETVLDELNQNGTDD